jgi:hypothetical protein
MAEDRSRHAICKLKTALRLVAGRNVRVPQRAFPAFNPSRTARFLQVANSCLQLPRVVARGHSIISGNSLAYVTGDLEYFGDDVARRAIRFLTKKQPFFVVSGDPSASLSSQIGCDAASLPRLRFSAQCVVIVTGTYQGAPAVFRVGDCQESRAEVGRQMNGLRLAASIRGLETLVPQQLAHRNGAGCFEVSVETCLPGSTAEFSWQRLDSLLELWLTTAQHLGPPARAALEKELTQVCDAFPAHHGSLSALKDALLAWHAAVRIPGAVSHGDLWLGNALFSGDAVTGLIDWEWACRDGLRIVDALNLLFMSYSVFCDRSIAHTLRCFWSDAMDDDELDSRLAALGRKCRLDRDDLKHVALLLWFDCLRQRMVLRERMPTREWQVDMIPRTLPVIARWLSQYRRASEVTAGSRTERLTVPGL